MAYLSENAEEAREKAEKEKKQESRKENEMILEEFIKEAVPSDRLIVEDSTGELYRGFVACLDYNTEIDRSREIKRHGLSADIYKKEKKKIGVAAHIELGEKVPVENISEFPFSNLVMMIYTKVVLEG